MAVKSPPELKPMVWLASTKRDLMALPEEVIDTFGYALYLAQAGKKHEQAKPLHGFGWVGVLEIVEDLRGDAYRALYTVRFAAAVFALRVLQSTRKSGIATSKQGM